MVVRSVSRDQEEIDELAMTLVRRASLLTRVVFRHAGSNVSRSEAGVLGAIESGPQRITTLAELEGLAQPTITLLVKRLEQRGWVLRGPAPHDGRVVLVSLTPDGRDELEALRNRLRPVLHDRLASLTVEQLSEFDVAVRSLEALIGSFQEEG